MKVKLRNPDRALEVAGDRKVHDVLGELGINSDTVPVIRRRELLTREEPLSDTDEIGEYSSPSQEVVGRFAEERGAELIPVDLEGEYGFDVPTAGRKGSRSTCAVCGLSKRYVFNRVALDHGFDVLATGHNLDDEAATLLGNTLRWQTDIIARQHPVLPAGPGLVRRVKPLHRLSELETATYAFLRGLDYVVEECPLVAPSDGEVARALSDEVLPVEIYAERSA